MGRLRTYECPHCGGRVEKYHHRADEPAPRFCELCGWDSMTLDDTLAMPALAAGAAKNVDGVIRAMEEGAEFRAQKVQQQFGASEAESRHLKLTDTRDGLREGDTANVPVVNDVTRYMAELAAATPSPMVGHVGSEQFLQYSAHVTQGKTPNAGARAGQMLKVLHGSQGNVTVDAPALETFSPNYRRRV